MSHHVTIYEALWTTLKENNVVNLVNGTVSQKTLPGVVRIPSVVETIFGRYHQIRFSLRSDSVRCSYKSLHPFHADPISVGERTQIQMAQDPVNTGHVVSHSSFPSANLSSHMFT